MFVPKTFVPDSATQQGTFTPKTFVPEKKTIGGFLGNVGKSAVNTVGGIGSALINTVNPDMEKNTVYNLGKLGVGAAELLIPGEQGAEQTARNVGNFYKQRYGGLSNIGNTLYNDPVGAALDASAVLGGAGAVAKGVGTIGKIDSLARLGSGLSEASALVDPIQATGRLAKFGLNKAASSLAPKLETASDAIILRGAGRPSPKLVDAAERAKTTPQGLIKKYNVFDRSSETAGAAKSGVLSGYDDIALNSGTKIPVSDVVRAFNEQIDKLKQGVGGEIADSDLSKIAELERRRDQVLRAVGQTSESTPLLADTSQVTNFRRKVIDPDVPKSMFGLDAKGSGNAQGVKTARDILRKSINSTDPRLEQLGLDYGALKELEKYLKAGEARGQGRQMFNFTRLGGAGIGGLISGAPGAIGGFLAEQMVNDPRFLKAASSGMSNAAEGLKNFKVSPVLSKNTSTAYKVAKIGRLFNPEKKANKPTKRISNQTLKETPYLPTSITPPVKPAYNFKQKVIKRPKNVFSKEQGGGNPFGGITKTVQDWQAQNRSNVSKIDVPDVPQSFVQGAITGAAGFTGLDKKIPIGREYTPKTNAGKVASVIGSGVGYAAGAGRYIAPAEKYIQGALNVPKVAASAPLITKAANVFAQKVVPPVATQMISSLPGAITNTVINKEKFLPTYAKSVAGGLAGRAIGAGVGAVADKVAPFFSKSNVFKAEQPKGMPGVIQKGLELERNFVSSTANGDIQPRNIGKYAEKLKLQTAAGGDPTTLFNKEIPLLLVQIPGKIGALKMSPSQIISNSNFIKYVTGPANESAKALFR